jgi:hypothetical protein
LLASKLVLILSMLASPLEAQSTTLVVLAPRVASELAAAYRPTQEQVWKVTAYDSTAGGDSTYSLVTVQRIEYVGPGEPHKIPHDVLAKLGRAPLIQASPADKEAAIERDSPFDGILCGDRYTTWIFASELRAIANYPFLLAQQGSH